jgi:hypothetical protein
MNRLSITNGHGPQIGDPCPRTTCTGVLGVYSTRINREEQKRIRWLSCNKCGCRPSLNVQIVPLHYSPPRKKGG